MRFIHDGGRNNTGRKRQSGYGSDRTLISQHVREHTGYNSANSVTGISPQRIDAHRGGPPTRVCDVANWSEQRGVDQDPHSSLVSPVDKRQAVRRPKTTESRRSGDYTGLTPPFGENDDDDHDIGGSK